MPVGHFCEYSPCSYLSLVRFLGLDLVCSSKFCSAMRLLDIIAQDLTKMAFRVAVIQTSPM